jgi:hypothetical protein
VNAPTRRPGDVNVDVSGEGSAGFGYVHLLNLSLVGGDWREVAGDVRRWSVWNWPQFLLVLLLDAVALLTAPEDTSTGVGWLYGVMVVTLVLSFCRVAGVVGVLADRAGPRWAYLPPSLSFGCVLLAALAVVGMRYYDEHGAVDVTGRTTVTPKGSLRDGERLTVTVQNDPARDHLRLVFELADAAPGAQSCLPATTYDARIQGSGTGRAEGVHSGEAFSLPLGGARGTVRVEAVLHTDKGCRMSVSVARAALHD